MFDLNDAQAQMPPVGDLIPDGTFAKVRMTIRPGFLDGATPLDAGLLKAGREPDTRMLDAEFTVVEGPFVRRKFWQNFTVAGGKLDEKGVSKGWNIAKASFRAMVDSALGLDPKDLGETAKAKRRLRGLRDLDGITFVAQIMIEPTTNPAYKDTNRLAHVVTPDEPQYGPVMRGETVPPEPINAKARKAPETVPSADMPWATPAAAAPSAPAFAAMPAPLAPASTLSQFPASAPTAAPSTAAPAAPAWLTPSNPAPAADAATARPAWLSG
ncbi:hypothetical protein C2U72_01750 [Prosthecomicrobium hirschii]|uniref:hypothetical protein n=1 Tax=Prosthecodimorpha hirschii TaxID=665126 RepID=UPI00112A0010|nr:hypothetical protein [Prosthecomicrobium hirschii]TPQ52711.1 hypothetical protein C2U72_01750 [Prosthecomicrobium hirschii]